MSAVRDALVAELRNREPQKLVSRATPSTWSISVLAVVDGVLVHHVLGIARPDGVIAELAERVLEPLRIAPSRKSKPKRKS